MPARLPARPDPARRPWAGAWVLLAFLGTAGCLEKAPAVACDNVGQALARAAAEPGGRVSVCGYVNGARRTGLVLTQAEPAPQSLPLVIDPAAAEQPDIAALLRAIEGRANAGGHGSIQARITGALRDGALKVEAVADLQVQ